MDGTPEEIVEAYTKAEDAGDDENDEAGPPRRTKARTARARTAPRTAGGAVRPSGDREAARRRAKRVRRERRRALREQGGELP